MAASTEEIGNFGHESRAAPAGGETADEESLTWIERDLRTQSAQAALVVSGSREARVSPARFADAVFVHHARGSAAPLAASFANGSFMRIYAHSAIAPVGDERLTGELRRILHREGTLLALAHRSDFAFAPLPAGGDVRALQRTLARAGFGDFRLEYRAEQFFALSARKNSG